MNLPKNTKFVVTNSYPYKVFVEQKPRKRTLYFRKDRGEKTVTSTKYLALPYVIFEFEIHLNGTIATKVYFKNTPLENDDKQVFVPDCLPNVDSDGNVCFGNIQPEHSSEGISAAIDELISLFWQSAFVFGESFNVDQIPKAINRVHEWEREGEDFNFKIEKKPKSTRRTGAMIGGQIGGPIDDKAILTKVINIEDFLQGNISGDLLDLAMKDPSEEIQLDAITSYPYMLKFIKNPSDKVKLTAVKSDGLTIRLIENPSEEMKLTAVKQNAGAIKYIKNPSEKLKLKAVKKDGHIISLIANPSEELKWIAIRQDGGAIRCIKNPSDEMKLVAVKDSGISIRNIKNPSKEMKLIAVKQNGRAIEYIKNPSEEMKLIAVKHHGDYLTYIKRPSEEVKRVAVNQSPYSIQWIDNPSEAVQLIAVKRNGDIIKYIKNPSELVQLFAVKQNGRSIQYIEKPSYVIQLTALDGLKEKNPKPKRIIIGNTRGTDARRITTFPW